MHPCASEEGKCCGGHNYAATIIRFTSQFHAVGAHVMLAYDVYPYCGDGIDLVVSQNFVDAHRGRAILMQTGCALLPQTPHPPQDTKLAWHFAHPGLLNTRP